MPQDLWEQLADMEVPPPPASFDAQLHERVNRAIVTGQLIDLFVQGLPWACLHFARALVGAAMFTLTGEYEKKK